MHKPGEAPPLRDRAGDGGSACGRGSRDPGRAARAGGRGPRIALALNGAARSGAPRRGGAADLRGGQPSARHPDRDGHVAPVAGARALAAVARRPDRGAAEARQVKPVSEAELHAYVDGALSEGARAEVEAWVASHPVNADEEEHLVSWLSKRLGTALKAPKLAPLGYELVGGRLLAGPQGPVAHFMYQDARGQRLTLYVSRQRGEPRDTAFRFSQEDRVSVFYWVDGNFGYALSGEVRKEQLLKVADVVYKQLNP